MALLAGSHACIDACQGAVPAMLPFLVARDGLSFAAASALVLAATISSSIVQPLFGAFSDRISSPWMIPGGIALACAGIAAAGVAPSYPLIFASILLSGLGVAAFHPEGSRFANYVSGARRATGMSYFSLGGNIGFALGPIAITPALLAFGPSGSLAFLVPAVAVASLVWSQLPGLVAFRPQPAPAAGRDAPAAGRDAPAPGRRRASSDSWRGLIQLLAVITSRSFAFYTLLALVPLYFIEVLDTSDATANGALTAMLIAGALGTLVGGALADRIGRRPVVVASLALQPPLLFAATLVGTGPAIALTAAFGFVAIASFSVTIVMAQEYMPSRIGLAAGLTLGAAVGIGGLAAPVFGWIGDELGLRTSVQVLALLPALGALIAYALPMPPSRRHQPGAAAQPAGAPTPG